MFDIITSTSIQKAEKEETMSVNKVILLGRLGQDPEMKFTPSGQGVCNFSIATSKKWTDKAGQKQERTEWHRIVVWGKLAELCNQYLEVGKMIKVARDMLQKSTLCQYSSSVDNKKLDSSNSSKVNSNNLNSNSNKVNLNKANSLSTQQTTFHFKLF